MLSFIRKRLPSKDRTNEHHDDGKIKKSELENEHNDDERRKKNKKNKSTVTISELVVGPSASVNTNQINQSYSNVDYFPMKRQDLAQPIDDKKRSDPLSDCYLIPSTNNQATTVIKPQVIQIPVIIISTETDYKDIDHERTKALMETIQQRTQQKLVK